MSGGAEMRIAVVGLGYVGSVEAAVLAASGRSVIGVDLREAVVEAMAAGRAPLAEPLLEERLATARSLGTLRATLDLSLAVRESDAALVCVGTPRGDDGELDTRALLAAVGSLARAVPEGTSYSIIVRSTVPPGLYAAARSAIDAARAPGATIGLALNPEFLREGSAVRDREDPQLVVYAADAPHTEAAIRAIYREHASRLVACDPACATACGSACSTWRPGCAATAACPSTT